VQERTADVRLRCAPGSQSIREVGAIMNKNLSRFLDGGSHKLRADRQRERLKRTGLVLALASVLAANVPSAHSGASGAGDPPANSAALDFITPEVIRPIIATLAGDDFQGRGAGYPGEAKAAEFIAGEFKKIGLEPAGDRIGHSYFQEFKFHPRHPLVPWEVLTSRNVLGFMEGSDPVLKEEIVVIGAHYDGQGRTGQADPFRFLPDGPAAGRNSIWPSANDNATGVSAVLAAAQAIKRANFRTKRSILFVAFGCEEHGMTGSIQYVTSPAFEISRHVAMINYEKLGRAPDKPLNAGSTGSSPAWSEILKQASSDTGTEVKVPMPYVIPDSDHYPFAASGIPAIIFSVSGPDEAHRVGDVAAKIDYARVAQYARYGLAVLLEVANRPVRLPYASALGLDPGLIGHLASDEEADSSGVKPPDSGLKVTGVIPGGAACRAGLKAGDLIVKMAGITPRRDMTLGELQRLQIELVTGKRGDHLPVTILRTGKQIELVVDLHWPPPAK
jgi:hypothetical protein